MFLRLLLVLLPALLCGGGLTPRRNRVSHRIASIGQQAARRKFEGSGHHAAPRAQHDGGRIRDGRVTGHTTTALRDSIVAIYPEWPSLFPSLPLATVGPYSALLLLEPAQLGLLLGLGGPAVDVLPGRRALGRGTNCETTDTRGWRWWWCQCGWRWWCWWWWCQWGWAVMVVASVGMALVAISVRMSGI